MKVVDLPGIERIMFLQFYGHWTLRKPENLFAIQVNYNFSLPKIIHPVNDVTHRKMGITIIKYLQFRPKFLPPQIRSFLNLLISKSVSQDISKFLSMISA